MDRPLTGGCRCGAVRYELRHILRNSICHCRDCQRSAGAPMVEWMLADEAALVVTGEPADYRSAPGTTRAFCPRCGTGLFYRNPVLFPGKVDIQTVTLDEPGRAPPPDRQVQCVEARRSAAALAAIPAVERYGDD